jgi:N-acetylglucosaminyldiphosphoundecaprenol N-acetyl-beta-D-mannosaminyltransferase
MESFKRIKILDIPVDMVNDLQAMEVFKQLMEKDGCKLIATPNSEIVLNANKDLELKQLIEQAALVIPDGIGIVYASRILGEPLSERVTGVDFLNLILEYLEETGKSIYLIGGKPSNEERISVAELAGKAMQEKYTKLKIAGTRDGYFTKKDEPEIVKEINASGAEFLCVALGSPKQEKFISEHKDEFVKVKVGMGVGGSLDVWAGTAKRAPEFYQRHGLEWLFRFMKEPTRYKRMAQLPLFIIKVIVKGKN